MFLLSLYFGGQMAGSEAVGDATVAADTGVPLASCQVPSPVPVSDRPAQNSDLSQQLPVQASDLSISSTSRPSQLRDLSVAEEPGVVASRV